MVKVTHVPGSAVNKIKNYLLYYFRKLSPLGRPFGSSEPLGQNGYYGKALQISDKNAQPAPGSHFVGRHIKVVNPCRFVVVYFTRCWHHYLSTLWVMGRFLSPMMFYLTIQHLNTKGGFCTGLKSLRLGQNI
jgi:hypothetical protein